MVLIHQNTYLCIYFSEGNFCYLHRIISEEKGKENIKDRSRKLIIALKLNVLQIEAKANMDISLLIHSNE